MHGLAPRVLIIIPVILACATAGFADSIPSFVTPPGIGTEGAGDLPLGGLTGSRIQTVFDASIFGTLGEIAITGIAVRPDQNNIIATGTTNLTLLLEPTAVTPTTLSNIFATNLGTGYTTAYNNSYTFNVATTGAGPRPFSSELVFTTPVTYDPSSGMNLLFDFTTNSPIAPPGTPPGQNNVVWLDSTTQGTTLPGPGDLIGSVVGVNNRFPGQGFIVAGGPVFELYYTPVGVPEPGTLTMLGLGIAGVAFGARRKKR
jgi:hypothetical protein